MFACVPPTTKILSTESSLEIYAAMHIKTLYDNVLYIAFHKARKISKRTSSLSLAEVPADYHLDLHNKTNIIEDIIG